jgi:hypothetical protein
MPQVIYGIQQHLYLTNEPRPVHCLTVKISTPCCGGGVERLTYSKGRVDTSSGATFTRYLLDCYKPCTEQEARTIATNTHLAAKLGCTKRYG